METKPGEEEREAENDLTSSGNKTNVCHGDHVNNKGHVSDDLVECKVDHVSSDYEDDAQKGSLEGSLKHKDTLSPVSGQESSGDSQGELPHLQSSHEELLAIMGNTDSSRLTVHRGSSHTTSEYSGDSFLLEQPCFLHIRVSHKCSAAHTYTPLNRGVAIDIPHGEVFYSNKALLQQVKTTFCFAVAEGRLV